LFSLFATTVAGTIAAFFAANAHAEPTSWLAVGGGYGFERSDSAARLDRAAAMSVSVGVGTSPANRFVVGGILRSVTYFSLGTDLSIAPRIATSGFARGDWGLALDAGVAARWWGGGDYGRYPLQFMVTGGAPWGIQLGVGTDIWNLSGAPFARGAVAILELDLLRLTVMRSGKTESYWPNSSPAGGHGPRD
jgi:hypothetical protein